MKRTGWWRPASQAIDRGGGRYVDHDGTITSASRQADKAKGLSGRQKRKARSAARRNAQRAAGLANVLAVKQTFDVFVDPRAKLVAPGDQPRIVVSRRPPSPRPG